jgi:hypothetical protein
MCTWIDTHERNERIQTFKWSVIQSVQFEVSKLAPVILCVYVCMIISMVYVYKWRMAIQHECACMCVCKNVRVCTQSMRIVHWQFSWTNTPTSRDGEHTSLAPTSLCIGCLLGYSEFTSSSNLGRPTELPRPQPSGQQENNTHMPNSVGPPVDTVTSR